MVVQRYLEVRRRIEQAAKRVGRDPAGIALIAVSKERDPASMQLLSDFLESRGEIPLFGESYVQEFRRKRQVLRGPVRAHLIGALQRNKAKAAVELFDVIESVDNLLLAEAVNKAAKGLGKLQDIFVQVNISDDKAKHGCSAAELGTLVDYIRRYCLNLRLRGFMTITRFYDQAGMARLDYKRLYDLAQETTKGWEMPPELSMGMSADFEEAIEEGATLVRVGSAIFEPSQA